MELDFSKIKALHCGCGKNKIPGFINTDRGDSDWSEEDFKLDVEKRFPYLDNELDYIYSEHMIEHLSYEGCKNFIQESYRCLKPGGVIRTAFPKIEFLIDAYKHPELYQTYITKHYEIFNEELIWDFGGIENIPISFLINDCYHMWDHKVMYDIPALKRMFEIRGFIYIKECEYGESEHQIFKGIEHSNKMGYECNKLETGIIECTKQYYAGTIRV